MTDFDESSSSSLPPKSGQSGPVSAAREAVARAIWDRDPSCDCDRCVPCCEADSAAVLAALKPFIAAEIRAWANGEFEAYDCSDMDRFDVIAARICGDQ